MKVYRKGGKLRRIGPALVRGATGGRCCCTPFEFPCPVPSGFPACPMTGRAIGALPVFVRVTPELPGPVSIDTHHYAWADPSGNPNPFIPGPLGGTVATTISVAGDATADMVFTGATGPTETPATVTPWRRWEFGWSGVGTPELTFSVASIWTGRDVYADVTWNFTFYINGTTPNGHSSGTQSLFANMEWTVTDGFTLSLDGGLVGRSDDPPEAVGEPGSGTGNFFVLLSPVEATYVGASDCVVGAVARQESDQWFFQNVPPDATWEYAPGWRPDAATSTLSSLAPVVTATVILDDESEIVVPLRWTACVHTDDGPPGPCLSAVPAINWMGGAYWNTGVSGGGWSREAITRDSHWMGRVWIPSLAKFVTIRVKPSALAEISSSAIGMMVRAQVTGEASGDDFTFDWDDTPFGGEAVLIKETTTATAAIDVAGAASTWSGIASMQLSAYTDESTDALGDALPDSPVVVLPVVGAVAFTRTGSRSWEYAHEVFPVSARLTAEGAWYRLAVTRSTAYPDAPSVPVPCTYCYSAPFDPARFPGMFWFEGWACSDQRLRDEGFYGVEPFVYPPAEDEPTCVTEEVNGDQAEDASNGGTIAWDAPLSAASEIDGLSVTSVNFGGSTAESKYLVLTDWGFAIPDGASIVGIEITFRGTADHGANVSSVKLVKGGSIAGDDKSDAAAIATSLTDYTYGGEDQLWGTTWDDDDINGTGFGLAIAFDVDAGSTMRIDGATVTVCYTEAMP